MTRKKNQNTDQLSLFEALFENNSLTPIPSSTPLPKPTTVMEFIKARLERDPEMTQEEYKRWIKILINNSIKSMD